MPGPSSPDRPAYAETEYPRRAFGWSPLAAWRADRFLFVRAPRRELYDVVADPAASHNLAATRSRVADGMDAELATFVRRTAGGDLAPPRVDRALAERLAALGYVGGSRAPPPGRGVDPKDRIAIANALHQAVAAVEDGAFRQAIPLLQRTVASEPTIQIAQLNLGIALAHQRQYAQAIVPLKKAVALQPEAMLGHYELAVALFETGDLDKAAGEFARVVAAMPKWADAHYSLGSVYARINRVPDAVRELTTALDLEPRHYRAHLLIGRIFSLQDRPADAVPHLRAAVDLQPSSAEAHQFLADAYEKAGNVGEAAKERRRAQELVVRN